MKRFFKSNNKKGFTLVEVMLATAIMAITSVMIMQGFMCTMALANNSNVYSKVAAGNYAKAAAKFASYAQAAITDGEGRYTALATAGGNVDTMTVNADTINAINLTTRRWRYTYSDSSSDVQGEANVFSHVNSDFDEVVTFCANRHTFFYVPTYNHCENCDSYGTIRNGYIINADGTNLHFFCTNCHWCADDSSLNTTPDDGGDEGGDEG